MILKDTKYLRSPGWGLVDVFSLVSLVFPSASLLSHSALGGDVVLIVDMPSLVSYHLYQ